MTIYIEVHSLIGRGAEIFEDEVDRGDDLIRDGFSKFHSTVDHDASVPEVQDLQVLEVAEVRLQVRDQLGKENNKP